MNLLLVNTPINMQETLGRFSAIYDDMKMVPTGIGYLAAHVREGGINVRILDQYSELLTMDKVFELIEEFKPDLIGYSATTPNYAAAIDFIRRVKKTYPKIPSVVGGYHPSILYNETLQEDAVDFVVRDEGEYTLLELCRMIEAGKNDFASIRGLSYKTADGAKHNPKGERINLDTLPFPAYDLLPMRLYSSPSYTKFASPVYQMIASRGCPYTCTYCINAEMDVSALYRKRNVRLVVDEMEYLLNQFGARQIQFWDPIFPLGRKHALEFCEELIKRGLHKKLVWNCTTRADILTEDMVDAMVASGCRGIGFGLESGVPELLISVKKKSNLEKVRQACSICRRKGLVVAASFIIGFPGETAKMTQQTIDFAKSLDIHYAQFSIMVPYPGTPLYNELVAKGDVAPDRDNQFIRYNQSVGLTDQDPVYIPAGRTIKEMKDAQKSAYTQFYLRPKMVFMHLPHVTVDKIGMMVKSFFAILRLAFSR